MTTEIWKDIQGFEGLYEVSDFGRIKSLSKMWICGNRGSIRRKGESILKLSIDSGGYCQVDLSKEGTNKKYFVHRIVANAFISNPLEKECVNHKNSTRNDNRVDNLEWCTHSENIQHAIQKNRVPSKKGELHHMSILTDEQVIEIRKLGNSHTQIELSKKFNIGRRTIGMILNRKLWTHI